MPSQCFCFQIRWLSFLWWYLWRHSHVHGAWCVQTLKETRQERMEGLLRLGMGWALPSCSGLCLGFWRALSKNPCPGLVHPSSCRRLPPKVSPYKDENISFRHPRLWLSLLQLITISKVTEVQTGLPFEGLSPQHRPTPSPGKCLCSMNIPTEMPSPVPLTLRQGGYSLDFKARQNWGRAAPTLEREKVICYGGALLVQAGCQKGSVTSWRLSKPF